MKLAKLSLKKISTKLIYLLTQRTIWCVVFLALLFFVWAALIFYRYVLVETPLPSSLSSEAKIKMELYQDILRQLKERETNIQKGIGESYPDVFR